jgi:hypothetical protein
MVVGNSTADLQIDSWLKVALPQRLGGSAELQRQKIL